MHTNKKFYKTTIKMCFFYKIFWDLKIKINFSYDGANFADIQAQTGYGHEYGELARYNGSPVGIGGYGSSSSTSSYNKKVEIFQSNLWREVAEYPTRYFLH